MLNITPPIFNIIPYEYSGKCLVSLTLIVNHLINADLDLTNGSITVDNYGAITPDMEYIYSIILDNEITDDLDVKSIPINFRFRSYEKVTKSIPEYDTNRFGIPFSHPDITKKKYWRFKSHMSYESMIGVFTNNKIPSENVIMPFKELYLSDKYPWREVEPGTPRVDVTLTDVYKHNNAVRLTFKAYHSRGLPDPQVGYFRFIVKFDHDLWNNDHPNGLYIRYYLIYNFKPVNNQSYSPIKEDVC